MYLTISVALSLTALAKAQIQQGFNYGATYETGACRGYQDFANLFNTAKSLPNAPGFSSARLYTMIQCGTTNDPISAIQAAIDTDTTLMLGLWASAGDDLFAQEVIALQRAITQYGTTFTNRVVGISVGSEDLYRSSPQGQANDAGVGASGSTIERYVGRVREALAGTPLAGKPIGHVDTWTAWVLPENAGVVNAVDFLGHNSFPYFESTRPNPIEEAANNFWTAVGNTESVAGGKPVWITETGWPHSGPTQGQAIASTENARTYYDTVGCDLFGTRNTWWYTLQDANTAQTEISFGLIAAGGGAPIYDLSCSPRGTNEPDQPQEQPQQPPQEQPEEQPGEEPEEQPEEQPPSQQPTTVNAATFERISELLRRMINQLSEFN